MIDLKVCRLNSLPYHGGLRWYSEHAAVSYYVRGSSNLSPPSNHSASLSLSHSPMLETQDHQAANPTQGYSDSWLTGYVVSEHGHFYFIKQRNRSCSCACGETSTSTAQSSCCPSRTQLPAPTLGAHNPCNSRCRGPDELFWPLWTHAWCEHTHAHAHMHEQMLTIFKRKIKFKKKRKKINELSSKPSMFSEVRICWNLLLCEFYTFVKKELGGPRLSIALP